MLPQNISETQLSKSIADKQTNYLILRTLESKLPPEQFKALISQVRKNFFSHNFSDWAVYGAPNTHGLGWITGFQLIWRVEIAPGSLWWHFVEWIGVIFLVRKKHEFEPRSNKCLDTDKFSKVNSIYLISFRHQKDSTLSGSPNVFSYLSKSLGLFN